MSKVAKIAASTMLGAAAMGATVPLVQGEPTTASPVISPNDNTTSPRQVAPPLHADTAIPVHHFHRDNSAVPRPRILMLTGNTVKNRAITISPMIHSPLIGVALLPESIKITPHGNEGNKWRVSHGSITLFPALGFKGLARASYSIEDAQGTIFTSSIDITVT